MNGEDLCVDAHQETQEIHMFDVYKVSESSPNAMSVRCKYLMALIETIIMMFIHIFIRYMYL